MQTAASSEQLYAPQPKGSAGGSAIAAPETHTLGSPTVCLHLQVIEMSPGQLWVRSLPESQGRQQNFAGELL